MDDLQKMLNTCNPIDRPAAIEMLRAYIDAIKPDSGARETSATTTPQKKTVLKKGVIAELGTLGSGAILFESGMVKVFGCEGRDIKRAVLRRELPAPTYLFGRQIWTAGAIVRHIEKRLNRESLRSSQTPAKSP